MANQAPTDVHVLIERDGATNEAGAELWVARFVERDLVTQAATLPELLDVIDECYCAHVLGSIEMCLDPWAEQNEQCAAASKATAAEWDTARIRITRTAHAWEMPKRDPRVENIKLPRFHYRLVA